jgi:hypothetical protein
MLFLAWILSGNITDSVLKLIDKHEYPAEEQTIAKEQTILEKIRGFGAGHPAWNLRIYRTPAGFRVLVTHQPFAPADPEVAECFKALDADPVYAVMCMKQQCFRARVSAKPWRIGVSHIKSWGTWPFTPERMAIRQKWIAHYENVANRYAACAFVETCGSGNEHPALEPVRQLHDELCQASSNLPIA